MNLQGDEPLMNLEDIRNLHKQMVMTKSIMGTLASNISDKNLYDDQNVVKVLTKESLVSSNFPEALKFMRNSSKTSENLYHHLGIYCYHKETLKKFVSLNQSENEIENWIDITTDHLPWVEEFDKITSRKEMSKLEKFLIDEATRKFKN